LKHFHINLFFSEEDDAWIADIPDLSMCSAFGDTPAEALAELELAKSAWMEAAVESGRPIPEPSYRPLIYQAAF
jgi:predicted RNase H-like HicB family nuclease